MTDPTLESRVQEWVVSRLGPTHMHRKERAMRLLEEALELAQAEGIAEPQVMAQIVHVFNRKRGEPLQEAGGVAVCLLGWCASTGTTLDQVAMAEILRIEAKPIGESRGSLARKKDQELLCWEVNR